MTRAKLHELGLKLAQGDRDAAFRVRQRLRGLMSAKKMAARGYPNLAKARQKYRARLKPCETPAKPRPLSYAEIEARKIAAINRAIRGV